MGCFSAGWRKTSVEILLLNDSGFYPSMFRPMTIPEKKSKSPKPSAMRACLSMLLFFAPFGCRDGGELEPKLKLADFTSDGCSLFIDGTFAKPELWKECCLLHDMAYWRGGTEEERKQADLAFKACVEKKTEDPILASLMYEAVRAGGAPHFPTWYRWGYGWPIGRGYKALTEEEEKLADKKLEAYLSQGK